MIFFTLIQRIPFKLTTSLTNEMSLNKLDHKNLKIKMIPIKYVDIKTFAFIQS